jgi:hypothetical protein
MIKKQGSTLAFRGLGLPFLAPFSSKCTLLRINKEPISVRHRRRSAEFYWFLQKCNFPHESLQENNLAKRQKSCRNNWLALLRTYYLLVGGTLPTPPKHSACESGICNT